jgi:uncharacterized membrane protein
VDALGVAWNATFSHIGPLVGFTLLYYIASFLVGLIPVGGFVANVFGFIFCCAMFSGYDSISRRGALQFESLFSWTPRFGRLLGAYLIAALIALALFLPMLVLVVTRIGFDFLMDAANRTSSFLITLRSLSGTMMLSFVLLGFAALVVLSVLTFALLFLVQFRDMSVGAALKLSMAVGRENPGQIILFILLAAGIVILGALACGVGLLAAMPMVYGMQYFMLRSIFPTNEAASWDFMRDDTPEV